MNNCTECIHQSVCDIHVSFGVTDFPKSDLTPCELFKPKSRCIEVPCSVGDTVYSIQAFNGEAQQCEPYTVSDISIYENNLVVIHMTDDLLFTRNIYVDDFGKIVFSSPEEARQALKRGKGNADT